MKQTYNAMPVLPDPKEETKDAVQITHLFLYDLGYKNINESYEVPTLQ